MNDNGYGNNRNPDIPDFNSRRDMDTIRRNEDYERQIRMKRAAMLQKQQRLKQLRQQQIKQAVTAWAILLFVVFAVIAILTGIFSSSGKDKNDDEVNSVGVEVSSEDKKIMSDFSAASYNLTGSDKLKTLDSFTKNNSSDVTEYFAYPSYYHLISDSMLFMNSDMMSSFKDAVRDCAIFNNGYVWSTTDNMRYPLTGGYLYDTNASFICAVYDICNWNANTEFLYAVDATTESPKDSSNGMTVLQKVEASAGYFFDKDDLNGGGIRYNEEDGLCYILTEDNNGKPGSKPSNIFYNHSFGYLDLYNNITFNRAMTALASIYTNLNDNEKASFYSEIAKTNKDAINNKFWNNNQGRYAGYIDKNGKVHDLGYTAINLYAIYSGIADKDKSDKILSWIDGERKINTDTLSYDKVYVSSKLPAFNTIAALDEVWYDSEGAYPYSGTKEFGKYWQNGGISYASAYFNIGARDVVCSDKVLSKNIDKSVKALDEVTAGKNEDIFRVTSAYLSAKKLFGLKAENNILYIDPVLSAKESFGIKNIGFSGNNYGIINKNGKLYITADLSMAVRIKVASPKDGTSYVLYVVEDGKILSQETPTPGKDGFIDVYKRFGSTSYIMLEKKAPKKTSK